MLRPTLTLDEIVEITGGALVDGAQAGIRSGEEMVTSVSTDTRTVEIGALFVALKGENRDGHDFIADAIRGGATALLVAKPIHPAPVPHIVVVDTLYALGDIARYVRDAYTGAVIGITGSVGKTTTKELVATALTARFEVHKSAANHNNEIGVPQTILSMQPSQNALIVEMGMRGTGEIKRL